MTTEGERVADDVAQLKAEFPGWYFEPYWQTVGNGPDARWLLGESLVHGKVTAPDAEEMRRRIREAQR